MLADQAAENGEGNGRNRTAPVGMSLSLTKILGPAARIKERKSESAGKRVGEGAGLHEMIRSEKRLQLGSR